MSTYKELLAAFTKIKNNQLSEEDYRLLVQEFQFEVYDAGYVAAQGGSTVSNID